MGWEEIGKKGEKKYIFCGSERSEDLEVLRRMKEHGLLDHRSVTRPSRVPGPGTRVIEMPGETEPMPVDGGRG